MFNKSAESRILFTVLSFLYLCSTTVFSEPKKYNRLIHEKSPYLQQHASNPIWWYPWGDEAFQAAIDQNKPIFLSIGYSTCHWCHVMEGDSFENEDVAALLNENFIAIKVDREERPDIDKLHMKILQAMTGRGGWPASFFLMPNRVPFTAGTFIPREQFIKMLQHISKEWKNNPDAIREIGSQVTGWLKQQQSIGFSDIELPDDGIFKSYLLQSQLTFDEKNAGFGKEMKFP
ncbi:MAG: thioredoxin domain-containing protein, partial [Proteobacteria bacterium]|nr:thioredoxin domain-containing protein [Pseudomonadota bacterium]